MSNIHRSTVADGNRHMTKASENEPNSWSRMASRVPVTAHCQLPVKSRRKA